MVKRSFQWGLGAACLASMSAATAYDGNVTPPLTISFEEPDFFNFHTEWDYALAPVNEFVARLDQSPLSGELFSSNALLFFEDGVEFRTSQVDISNFRDVSVDLELLTEQLADFDNCTLEVELWVKGADSEFSKVPWLSLAREELVDEVIVGFDAPKAVLVPAAPVADDWYQLLTFDDSGWIQGTGGAGFEGSPTSTHSYVDLIGIDLLSEMRNKATSAYVRVPFSVSSVDELQSLSLAVHFDDGFVAWINGVKVEEKNAPWSLSWNSQSDGGNADVYAIAGENFDVTESLGVLVEGQNLLAVQGLNTSSQSADFLISLAIMGGSPDPNGPPTLDDFADTGQVFSRLTTPSGLISDSATSVFVRIIAGGFSLDAAAFVDNISISGTKIVPDDFESYLMELGVESAPYDGDEDHDGQVNFLEYAMGSSPLNARETGVASVTISSLGYVDFFYPQLSGEMSGDVDRGLQVDDVRYQVQFSPDGRTWFDGTGEPLFYLGSVTGAPGGRTSEVRLRSLWPIGLEYPQGFFRLKVSQMPPAVRTDPRGDPFAVPILP